MLDIDSLINMRMMGILSDGEVLSIINKFRSEYTLLPLAELPKQILEIFSQLELMAHEDISMPESFPPEFDLERKE